ncbi:MAG: hypothetical protein A2V81_02725 [Candidatus Abawacabacteria bacterium RBG_16_42_10]|uniref:Addiction module toxin RelE n=1 Tax=Candidatus Abawacabacteria bacterium RBG_16_42_10 TaxID=1817814 RepID=A0A1F4XK11_9BACT|nr:MAG: hypothetical protein A2V81_02725 [Candidatus Abawacabacteria bacterium RBG_16_42_10]
MAYDIDFSDEANADLYKLDQSLILRITEKIIFFAQQPSPSAFGKILHGKLRGMVRFRVGDYRIVCLLDRERRIIQVIRIGHRRDVYFPT